MNRKRLRLALVGLLATTVALGVVLGVGTRYQTSYGTATKTSELAGPVREMRATQQVLAKALGTVLKAKQPQVLTDAQSSMAESVFSQYAAGECRIGEARYLDTYSLSGVDPQAVASYKDLTAILHAATAEAGLGNASVQGNQVILKASHFRVQVNVLGEGASAVYQLQVPVLQNPQDMASASCYPVSGLPLSAVRSLR